jgi:AAA+ superfamily predicted ATPase
MLKTLESYELLSIIIRTNFEKKIIIIIPNKIEKENLITTLKNKPVPITIENG